MEFGQGLFQRFDDFFFTLVRVFFYTLQLPVSRSFLCFRLELSEFRGDFDLDGQSLSIKITEKNSCSILTVLRGR